MSAITRPQYTDMNASSDIINPSYTQESEFEQAIHANIADFWQSRQEGFLTSRDKKRLFWVKMTAPHHTRSLFIVNGRIESCWKYQEIFYDLFQQGFDIYSYDHRGQGLSERLIDNREMGYVGEFDDYIADMAQMVENFHLDRYQDNYLLAHSMGGTIATRYLQTRTETPFSAVSLSAPMFGVSMPWYFKPVALPLSQILSAVQREPIYAPGYQAYYPKPFKINPLSQSEVRYHWFRDLYEKMPELKIGGPSIHWVWQGLMAAKQCIQLSRQIKIPLLLLQAGEEAIVSNQAQRKFIKKLEKTSNTCKFKVIEGAKHEVLFEQDQFRNQALQATISFFNAYQKGA